jgi:hypothetical protein
VDAIDLAAVGDGFKTHAQWVVNGIVSDDTENGVNAVLFTDPDSGQALPYPMVLVKLVGSGVVVPCRVASFIAGEGESEWYPFVSGDEVLVAIPEGDERAGCAIIGRFNQALDNFPTSVGGNDPTTNTFGFQRMRAPFVLETAASYLLRSALTGSYIGLDTTGAITLTTGDGDYLSLSHDLLGMQTADSACSMQINTTTKQTTFQAKGTSLVLDDQKSAFLSAGTLTLVTSGGGYAPGHAITLEQVVVLIEAFLVSLVPAINAITSSAGVPLTKPLIDTALLAALPLAATSPISAFTSAITGALSEPPDPTGIMPGVGRAGLMV